MVTRKRGQTFSVSKAVKANARERVGQPKPSRVLRDRIPEDSREAKHRETATDLLARLEKE